MAVLAIDVWACDWCGKRSETAANADGSYTAPAGWIVEFSETRYSRIRSAHCSARCVHGTDGTAR